MAKDKKDTKTIDWVEEVRLKDAMKAVTSNTYEVIPLNFTLTSQALSSQAYDLSNRYWR